MSGGVLRVSRRPVVPWVAWGVPAVGFEIKDVDLAGRIGVLRTRHGSIETPAFC